jgi:hypothetical protein
MIREAFQMGAFFDGSFLKIQPRQSGICNAPLALCE